VSLLAHLRSSQQEYRRRLKRKLARKGKQETWDKQRRKYQKLGPIRLIEDLQLTIKGKPIIFSEDQIEFLTDLATNKVRFAILLAGRGAGKTLCLAVYILWRIVCFDNWDITAMGGSSIQSEKIQWYIEEWMRTNDFIRKSIIKSTHAMGKAKVQSKAYNEVMFHTCSETSVRGAHTKELMLDEVCSGERAGNVKSIKASFYDVSTSEDIHLIMTSTAHYLFGVFVDIWNNAEKFGFKRYRWSIAKHESGEIDPYKIYKFKSGWLPNCSWFSQNAIDHLRRNSSDEEWLVEALGGIATLSGSVFNPEDLELAVCDVCEECEPYKFPQCTLVKPEELKRITERRLGVDWGEVEPNAYTVVGRLKDNVFVLFNDELAGVRDKEAVDFAERTCKKWGVEIVLPDPAQYPLNYALSERGLTVHRLFSVKGGIDKLAYVSTAKRHFERCIIHIPKKYDKLISSLKQLSYDKKGRIRKINDHSSDSLFYALSEFMEDRQKIYKIKRRFTQLWKK